MASRSRDEQETIIRWDEADADAWLWTASPRQAARWRKWGYSVQAEPGGWSARVPKRLIMRGRRLVAGHDGTQKARGNPAALQIYRAARQKTANQGSGLPAKAPLSEPQESTV